MRASGGLGACSGGSAGGPSAGCCPAGSKLGGGQRTTRGPRSYSRVNFDGYNRVSAAGAVGGGKVSFIAHVSRRSADEAGASGDFGVWPRRRLSLAIGKLADDLVTFLAS